MLVTAHREVDGTVFENHSKSLISKKNRGCEATELHTSVDQRNSSRFGLLKPENETFFDIFIHCGSVWLLFALISHFLPVLYPVFLFLKQTLSFRGSSFLTGISMDRFCFSTTSRFSFRSFERKLLVMMCHLHYIL